MTSQPKTQLTNIDSALAALRDGRQTVEQIGQYIGGLWQAAIDANDQTAISYYEAAWGLANVLAESNDNARAIVQEVTGQRDQVAAAYSEYQTAVINMDMEHPEAGRHIKLIHSAAHIEGHDNGWDEGYEDGVADSINGDVWTIMSNDPSDDFYNGIFCDFDDDSGHADDLCEKAEDFALMLFADSDASDIFSMALRQKLAAFIVEIHPQIVAERAAYDTRMESERRERETRWAAERAARNGRVAAPMTDNITDEDDDDYDENTDPDA